MHEYRESLPHITTILTHLTSKGWRRTRSLTTERPPSSTSLFSEIIWGDRDNVPMAYGARLVDLNNQWTDSDQWPIEIAATRR